MVVFFAMMSRDDFGLRVDENFIPEPSITVDEQLFPTKAWYRFSQYMAQKPCKVPWSSGISLKLIPNTYISSYIWARKIAHLQVLLHMSSCSFCNHCMERLQQTTFVQATSLRKNSSWSVVVGGNLDLSVVNFLLCRTLIVMTRCFLQNGSIHLAQYRSEVCQSNLEQEGGQWPMYMCL